METPKKILTKHNIIPNKRLGQNFLTDKKILAKIIQAADLSPDDIVLEVGPGTGILTLELAKYAKKVIAVEKDRKIAEILKNILIKNNIKNVEIIEEDILKLENFFCHPERSEGSRRDSSLAKQGQNDKFSYKLVANIPYYLTSPLIRKFLESKNQPEFMILMIQKEVAQRICAKPPRMSLLSVATQFYAEPKIISYVSKKSFFPQPKVDSAIIKMTPKKIPSVIAIRRLAEKQSPDIATGLPRDLRSLAMTKEFRDRFFKVAKAAFSQPRKQLINNLSKGLSLTREQTEKLLSQCGIKPTQRPSELSVDKYLELAWKTYGK
jgi:16S rRNA (adenine1518-N6/adenine1519-N6)-dimethyltransferase